MPLGQLAFAPASFAARMPLGVAVDGQAVCLLPDAGLDALLLGSATKSDVS